ncbi:hypothetical protein [Halalkalicoccus tibetensis]|uniref:Uncharacterized protein n=1 Tax=Halalkalicoccus tibetensis TaxID=175632 RepID=A0ABD5V8T0_9EURY
MRNFKQCAEGAGPITITADRDEGFYRELELLVEAPYSLEDELVRMLQTDRVEIADLRVEESCTIVLVQIF